VDPHRTDPVRLVLPPTGALVVRAIGPDGKPFAGAKDATLYLLGGLSEVPEEDVTGDVQHVAHTFLRRGETRFPYVAPGKVFRCEVETKVEGARRGRATFLGPRVAGAEAVGDVPCGAPALVAAGRVAFDDGAAMGGATVSITPVVPRESGTPVWGDHGGRRTEAKDDGSFRVTLDVPATPPWPEKLRVSAAEKGRSPWGASLLTTEAVAPPARDGVVDLGTLIFKRRRPLVSGTVVDRNGSPVQGARLQLFSRIDGRYHQDWRYQDATSGRDGGFEIFDAGPNPDGIGEPRFVGATLESACCFEPPPFAPGATGVQVALQPAGRLEGSVNFGEKPEDRPSERTWFESPVEIRLGGPPAESAFSWNFDPVGKTLELNLQGDRFDADALKPGIARVEFRLRGSKEALLTIDGVDIRGGEVCKDPRLQNVDLSGLVGKRTVTVVDEAGAPIVGAVVYTKGLERRWIRRPVGRSGRAHVVCGNESPEAYVTAPQRRGKHLGPLVADVVATLVKATPCRVVVRLDEATPVLEDPYGVGAQLVWAAPAPGGGAPSEEWDHPFNQGGRSQGRFGKNRTLTLEASEPGVYVVAPLVVFQDAHRGMSMMISDPERRTTITIAENQSTAEATISIAPATLKQHQEMITR